MAALERGFAVVSVEAIEYHFDTEANRVENTGELVHLWLHGEAYNSDSP